MRKIIGGKLYDTETSTMLANDEFLDGSNRLSGGRGTYLYRTAKGNFFVKHETCWQGERNHIEPLNETDAKRLFEELNCDADEYEEYFGAPEAA